jgi:uncharacterized protein (DUF885 family)
MRFRAALLIALAPLACHEAAPPTTAQAPGASAAATAGVEVRRNQLRAIIDDQWEYTMRREPVWASMLGDKRYNDRWEDNSEKATLEDLEQARKYVAELEAIDTTGFPEQERLDEALLARQLKLQLEGARFEPWLMPANHFFGVHLDLAEAPSLLPFATVKDYDDYVTRLRTLPVVLQNAATNMRKGMAEGLMPPAFLLGKVAQQADEIAAAAPDASAFAGPLRSFPDGMPEADRARIRAAVLGAITGQVAPAYRAFASFVRDEYAPHGRTEPGVWSLPHGAERYAFAIKESTSTELTAEAIHQTGLQEVARIEAEMLAIARKLGFSDLKSFAAGVDKNPALHFSSRKAILDLYQHYTDAMAPKLPALFGRLPRARLVVLPIEEFEEKTFSGARYDDAAPDGSRPGHLMVNTGDFEHRTTLDVESTAYHEGLPGHHMQIAIAQEVPELPLFRQHYFVTAYVEGWALYSEELGKEVGLYQDPYSDYGRLLSEMLRAIRLVADTGIHAKKWTRQQVVDFFHAHSTLDEVEVQHETDRYIAVPAQALAYKVGQLEIRRLRDRARAALGDKFDIRAFHDLILGSGALPLDVLDQQVDAWIATRSH